MKEYARLLSETIALPYYSLDEAEDKLKKQTEITKKAKIPEEIPVFTLQGGFDLKKLTGAYKFAMSAMVKVSGKALQKKEDKTEAFVNSKLYPTHKVMYHHFC